MHVILLRFGNNKASAPTYMKEHNAWIANGMSDGVFQCVGSLNTGGGFVLAHGENDDEIRQRVDDDPFVRHEIVVAEIHRVDVNRTVPQLEYLVSA